MSAATLQPSAKEKPRENVTQEESNGEGMFTLHFISMCQF